ncbi:putative virion structural protein 11 [Salmonella phage SPFM1]|nr:putative virion structural protein 11 [Salmonella phage SPFM1]VFR11392.1 putative virion structural protein 11 [Salmonella phage SPFM6]
MKPLNKTSDQLELSLYCLNFGGRLYLHYNDHNGRNKAELPTNPAVDNVLIDNWTTYRNPIDFNLREAVVV